MAATHVTIWIDHKEAHVLYFDADQNELIKSHSGEPHLHHKKNSIGSGKAPIDHDFFDEVMRSVADVEEILIVGPGSAKGELVKHVAAHQPALAKKIIGVETVDHPSDGQVLDYARRYFKRIDRMI